MEEIKKAYITRIVILCVFLLASASYLVIDIYFINNIGGYELTYYNYLNLAALIVLVLSFVRFVIKHRNTKHSFLMAILSVVFFLAIFFSHYLFVYGFFGIRTLEKWDDMRQGDNYKNIRSDMECVWWGGKWNKWQGENYPENCELSYKEQGKLCFDGSECPSSQNCFFEEEYD